ncbi:MAG: acyltransferase, partial [Candidatus Acidiferrales bacterium]
MFHLLSVYLPRRRCEIGAPELSTPVTAASTTQAVPLDLSARIPELDGIRGVAIAMILVAHCFDIVSRPGSPLAYALVPLHLDWTGVDLFFVLSGFLIGGILLDARESSNYFRVFYTRRFFRIVPIYAVLLLCAAVVAHLSAAGIIGKHDEIFQGHLSWLYFATFLQNIGMAVHNVWGTFPLGVTWSLAVEEQFYLTLPLAIRFLSRRALLLFLPFAVVCAPLLRTFFFHRFHGDLFTWYTLMPCRADALLLGVLGAIALREPRWRAWLLSKHVLVLTAIGILLLGAAYLCWRAPSAYNPLMATAGFTWLALTYLSILLYALLYRGSWLSHCLRWSWLRGLGAISYGAYLFHEFFLGMIYGRTPWVRSWDDVGLSVLALVLTISFCRLSWLYFEKPLVKIGHRASYEF